MSYTVDDPQMGAALALVALLGLARDASASWTVHDDGALSANAYDETSFKAIAGLLECPSPRGGMARAMWRGVLVTVWPASQMAGAA